MKKDEKEQPEDAFPTERTDVGGLETERNMIDKNKPVRRRSSLAKSGKLTDLASKRESKSIKNPNMSFGLNKSGFNPFKKSLSKKNIDDNSPIPLI